MVLSLPSDLASHDGPGYWGITPEAIALATNAYRTEDEEAWDALERYYDIQILLTNHQPEKKAFDSALETICDKWFPSPLDKTLMFATPQTVTSIVAGAAYYDTPSGVANVIIRGQDLLDRTDANDPLSMSRRDLHGYAETESSKRLLRSLNVIRAVPSGYELNRSLITSISTAANKSHKEAAYSLVARIIGGLGIEVEHSLVNSLLEQLNVTPPETPPSKEKGALSILVRDNSLEKLVDTLFSTEFEEILKNLSTEANRTRNQLLKTRRLASSQKSEPTSANWPLQSDTAGVCGLASRQRLPVAAGWLASRENCSELELAKRLANHNFDIRYDDGLLHFDRAYEAPEIDHKVLDDYNDWIGSRLTKINRRQQIVEQLSAQPRSIWETQRHRLLESVLQELDTFTVSPTRFVYTIFDPEFHTDSSDIDKYIGESPELEHEVNQIRYWKRNRPHDAASFADIIPEVLNYPLENSDAAPVVRIMTPWTNFAVKEYVGLFKRLIENNIRIQLLFRLPESYAWSNLKDDMLAKIGDTEGRLELRTYTRYKQYRDHTELRELENKEETLSETGIHAKLFVAGDESNGTVLAGSANLMENSFYYNSEAGIQTQNPNVVETAIDYFDLVWDLAVHDRIPEDAYTGDTEFRYYPSVYRPQ